MTVPPPVPEGPDLALRLALDGLETGRYLLVDVDGILAVVGDGVSALLGTDAAHPGGSATAVLGDVGDPLPHGVARCAPGAGGPSVPTLEATFAPVAPEQAEAVRAELDRLAATLGAATERPALRTLLAGAAGRPAEACTHPRDGTLVLLRRADVSDLAEPQSTLAPGAPPEAIALIPVLEELRSLRAEISELRERDLAMPAHERVTVETELRQARSEARIAREETARLRDDLAQLRNDVTSLGEDLGEATKAAVLLSEDARRDALAARSDAEAARAEVQRERERGDSRPAVRPERVAEIWRQMLAANAPDAAQPETPPRGLAQREAALQRLDRPTEPGFDDVAAPMAKVSLDGRFLKLNPGFSALVGYGEAEFGKATWPSLLDRELYDAQCESRAALVAGAADRVALDASYLGGQGLLVVVRGHVELVRDASGVPTHLLLVGEDRHTL